MLDEKTLRERITKNGWQTREIPVRGGGPDQIKSWKVIAAKASGQSASAEGKTLQLALYYVGQMVGIV